jgi:predicted aspartyl protease
MPLLVVLTFFRAACFMAEDKPSAKQPDKRSSKHARWDVLVRAGYTPVPLTASSEGMLYVEGTVGSEKVRFKLASGEAMTVIDFAVARRQGLALGEVVPAGKGSSYVSRAELWSHSLPN